MTWVSPSIKSGNVHISLTTFSQHFSPTRSFTPLSRSHTSYLSLTLPYTHLLTPSHRSFTVRVHVGLDTFVNATGMEEMGGITSSSSSTSPMQPPLHWHNGIVPRAPHEVENAFQEVSKSLIPMVAENHAGVAAGTMGDGDDDDDFNSTAGELSAGGTPESPSRHDHRRGGGGGGGGSGHRGQHHRSPTSPPRDRARSVSPSSVNKSLSAGSMNHSPTSSTTPSPSTKSIYSEVSKGTEATTTRMPQQQYSNGTYNHTILIDSDIIS